ncbi:MAG: hypothetical protein KC621_10005 [Myxococcales bacterium]|nr:hypothetical protein [Myxococcales bacterium]
MCPQARRRGAARHPMGVSMSKGSSLLPTPVVEKEGAAAARAVPALDQGLGNRGFVDLSQGLMGEREAPSLLDALLAAPAAAGDAAGLGDPTPGFSFNVQDVFDPAGRAAGWAEANGADWARRFGLERLGSVPLSVAMGEGGITGGQVSFTNGWSVGASGDGVSVGYGESGATVSAGATHAFGVTTGDEGVATGSDLRLGTHLGAKGTLALARYRVGGGYTYDGSTEVHAGALPDGTVLDPTALAARAALVETRELDPKDGQAHARTLVDELRTWQAGDRVRVATESEGSLDLGIAGPAGFSVGGGSGGIGERVVESLGQGVVRVTMANTDVETLGLAASAGFGAASLGVSGRNGQLEVQQVTFDLEAETGRRDFLLNQYVGLLPGSAEALGIETEAEALAFIRAGGMAGRGLDLTAAELNASLAGRAAADADFATAHGYTDLRKELEGESGLDLSVLGISLFSSSFDESLGERTTYEAGERARSYTGAAAYRQGGWFAEDAQAGSAAKVASGGAFEFSYTSSFDGRTDEATGPLADLRARREAAERLVDDPVLRQSVRGETDALLAATLRAELDPRALARAIHGQWSSGSLPALEASSAAMAALQAMVDEPNGSALRLITIHMDEIGKLAAGEIEPADLSAEAAAVFSIVAVALPGEHRFDVLGVIAKQTDPDRRAQLLAVMIASGGENVTADFLVWAGKHPEIAATLTVDTELVAGSTEAMSIVTRGEAGKDVDAGALTADLVALGARPEELELVLAGLDRTLGVNDDGIGGVDRLLANLPTADLAAVLALGANSELVRQATVRLAKTRPDLLIPPELSLEDRTAWVRDHLVPALVTAGVPNAGDLDPASLVAHARGLELRRATAEAAAKLADTPEGVARQLIDGLGPFGASTKETFDLLVAAGLRDGPEAMGGILEAFGSPEAWGTVVERHAEFGGTFDTKGAVDLVEYLVYQALLSDEETAVRLLEVVQGTPYEGRVEGLISELGSGDRVERDAAMFARTDHSP